MADDNDCREAFERHYGRAHDPSRILWRRGGTTFAEHIDAEDYADAGVQRKWNDWQAAWEAALAAVLADGVQPTVAPSIYEALPPSAMDWLTSSDPHLAATQEWQDGWNACRDRVHMLVDEAVASGVPGQENDHG
jgi:hypothetical protein